MLIVENEYLLEMIRSVRVADTEVSRQEVTDLILAAAVDLNRQGVKNVDLDEPLTKQAVKLYCKGNYGYDEGGRFQKAYEALSAAMALSGDYDEDGDADE